MKGIGVEAGRIQSLKAQEESKIAKIMVATDKVGIDNNNVRTKVGGVEFGGNERMRERVEPRRKT